MQTSNMTNGGNHTREEYNNFIFSDYISQVSIVICKSYSKFQLLIEVTNAKIFCNNVYIFAIFEILIIVKLVILN